MEDALNAFVELMDMVNRVNQATAIVISIVSAIIAIGLLINCFFGYKLIRLQIAISGFFMGAIIGAVLGAILADGSFNGLAFLLILVGGILGVKLAFTFYKIGIFLYAATVPTIFGVLLGGLADNIALEAVGVLIGCIFGVLGVLLSRPYLIAITAIPSGMSAGPAVLTAFGIPSIGGGFLLGVILAIAGFIVQWKTTGITKADLEQKRAVSGEIETGPTPNFGIFRIKKKYITRLIYFIIVQAILVNLIDWDGPYIPFVATETEYPTELPMVVVLLIHIILLILVVQYNSTHPKLDKKYATCAIYVILTLLMLYGFCVNIDIYYLTHPRWLLDELLSRDMALTALVYLILFALYDRYDDTGKPQRAKKVL